MKVEGILVSFKSGRVKNINRQPSRLAEGFEADTIDKSNVNGGIVRGVLLIVFITKSIQQLLAKETVDAQSMEGPKGSGRLR